MTCNVCADKGFVRYSDKVSPCPNCNPDSGYEVGEYQAELVSKLGRCRFTKFGGGRTCPLPKGHKQNHYFQCGR